MVWQLQWREDVAGPLPSVKRCGSWTLKQFIFVRTSCELDCQSLRTIQTIARETRSTSVYFDVPKQTTFSTRHAATEKFENVTNCNVKSKK